MYIIAKEKLLEKMFHARVENNTNNFHIIYVKVQKYLYVFENKKLRNTQNKNRVFKINSIWIIGWWLKILDLRHHKKKIINVIITTHVCVTGIHYNTLKYNLDVKCSNHLDVYAVDNVAHWTSARQWVFTR